MLLEEAISSGENFKLMASQPRRIAASSLMKRLRESIGSKVGNMAVNRVSGSKFCAGLRMGFGIKDEYDDTR